MPVAKERDFIFIHVPKCGGASVIDALQNSKFAFTYDAVGLWNRLDSHPHKAELIRRLKAVYPSNTIGNFPEQHLPATILREFVGQDTWDRSFKFAFVRNPWDLVVSTYQFLNTYQDHFALVEPDFRNVIEAVENGGGFRLFVRRYPMLFSDTMTMLTDDSGNLIVDATGRFEKLEQDFTSLCARLGIEADLPHLNQTEHQGYQSYYEDETIDIVARHFAPTIRHFGYSF